MFVGDPKPYIEERLRHVPITRYTPIAGLGCSCKAPVRGLGASMNRYDDPGPEGVPNPYGIRYHAYPTRYHGPIYTRPMFGFPWHELGVNWGALGPGMEAFPPPGAPWGDPEKFNGLGEEADDKKAFAIKLALVGAVGLALVMAAKTPRHARAR